MLRTKIPHWGTREGGFSQEDKNPLLRYKGQIKPVKAYTTTSGEIH